MSKKKNSITLPPQTQYMIETKRHANKNVVPCDISAFMRDMYRDNLQVAYQLGRLDALQQPPKADLITTVEAVEEVKKDV